MSIRANALIHFFDREVLDLYAVPRRYDEATIQTECGAALKIGCLFSAGQLLLPLSSYFESELISPLTSEWEVLFAAQELQLVSSELDIDHFVDVKHEQYKREPDRHPRYFDRKVATQLRDLAVPMLLRRRSSTHDIGASWRDQLQVNTRLIGGLATNRKTRTIGQFERRLFDIPTLLGGDAFIWDYVRPLLPVSGVTSEQTVAVKELISRSYVRSYLDEFAAYVLCDLRIGDFRCGLGEEETQSVLTLRRMARLIGIAKATNALSWADILELKYNPVLMRFAEQVRSWCSLSIPPTTLRAIQTATLKISDKKADNTKKHVIRTAALIVEELTSIDAELSPLPSVGQPSVDFTPLKPAEFTNALQKVLAIRPGNEAAADYERAIEPLLTALFQPVLTDPEVQAKMFNGRKRVDITYVNAASIGLFSWLALHYRAAYIFVECKNYVKEIGNPELDQLSGRFSKNRGQVGLLLCRSVDNEKVLMDRCRDTATDGRGFIIPIDDRDLTQLVESKTRDVNFFALTLLRRKFGQLVM
jgi:hypothetical protein